MTHSHQGLVHDIYPALLGQDLEHGHEGLQGGMLKVRYRERGVGHVEEKRYLLNSKMPILPCFLVSLYFTVHVCCTSLYIVCLYVVNTQPLS